MKLTEANRLYKDRVFKFIFGNPENKEWTLSLYNAVNGSNYRNPDDIQFNTIEDAVYMSMKNDVSFIILDEMNLWEHQSSFNPNMPMRFLTYGTQLYEKYTATSGYYKFSRKLQRLPKPHCICFYNGTKEQPEQQVLKLSDAFGGEGDIEVKVKMLNVNYGKNRALLETCQPLREYAWLVDRVREHQRVLQNLEAAVDASIDEMPDSFVIRTLIEAHRAGVKKMFLTEYDEEKMKEQERKEAFADGVDAGVAEANERVAADMLKKKYPLDAIKDISRLSEAHIRKLAKSLGVVVL
ncbi:MAG: hypothetical protein II389_01705 [Acidaminococcaceae bacterium]|nr:hypothetical protein [Acidaminococcaceae bacterium]